MLIIILVFIFISITFLVYKSLPFILEKYSKLQQKRIVKAEKDLDKMFIFKDRKKLAVLFTAIPLALGAIGFILLNNILGFGMGLAAGFILPSILIKSMNSRRINKFSQQLVDGIMILSSSLKAGLSLIQAIEIVVEEMPPPISDEFNLLIKENRMGVSLENCLAHLKQRMPIGDVKLISNAVVITQETGGDLTRILEQLAFTIREKVKLAGKVKSLTVQGRLQGAIMGLLPIVFAIFTYFVNPDSFNLMLNNPLGQKLLILAVILEVAGLIAIKKLSKVKV